MVTDSTATRQNGDSLWDVADVAKYLKVSKSTIRAYILRREIPFLRVGSLIRFRRDEVDAWVDAGQPVPAPEEGVA